MFLCCYGNEESGEKKKEKAKELSENNFKEEFFIRHSFAKCNQRSNDVKEEWTRSAESIM